MKSKQPATVLALVLAGVAAASFAGAAFQSPPSSATIEFRALTPEGQPILDLKKEEITLKVNGKAREVRSIELVKMPAGADAAPAAATPSAMPFAAKTSAPFATNTAPAADGSRNVLLVIADESVSAGQEQTLRDATAQLLTALAPTDRVTLLNVPHGSTSVNATTDRAAVTAAITAMRGKASAGLSTTDRECLTLLTLQALKGLFTGVPATERPTVVFFSAGLLPAAGGTTLRNTSSSSGSSDCTLSPSEYQNLSNAALATRANSVVVFLPDAMQTNDATQKASLTSGVENLAGLLNASLIRFTGTGAGMMARVAAETSAYYKVTFDPDSSERNGAKYRVDLKVTRDRADVRTPPDVTIAKPGAAKSAKDMTRVAEVFTDLPLRATAYATQPKDASRVSVVTLFEPAESGAKLTTALVAIFDANGKLVAQTVPLEAADVQGSPSIQPLEVAPGAKYRVRVAATDASGRGGTVDYELDAMLPDAAPGKMSSLVLGVPKSGSFSPRLQFGPADGAVIGYLEVYGMPASAAVDVSYELAESLDAVAAATGKGTITKGSDRIIVTGGFNLSAAAPGDYVMRAVVSVDGKVVGRASRTIRKTK